MSVGKLDQPLDLGNGKSWEPLVYLIEAVSKIVAVHNRVGYNARTAHDGSSRYLAVNALDQLTGRPIDV